MADIYGYKRNPKPRGVFSSEDSFLTFGSVSNPIGYMIQSWGANYQQQVQELFEIGSSALYWMKGRPQGTGQMARVLGEVAADTGGGKSLFPLEAYDLCEGGALLNIRAASPPCGGTDAARQEVSISMDGCVVVNIGFSVQVSNTLINESVAFRFAYMDLT